MVAELDALSWKAAESEEDRALDPPTAVTVPGVDPTNRRPW
jgi:hypothetical protein